MNLDPKSLKNLNVNKLIVLMEAIIFQAKWSDKHPGAIVVREAINRLRSMPDRIFRTQKKPPEGVLALFALDGYDDCVVGAVAGDGRPDAIAYDMHRIIKKLQEKMTFKEAVEFFELNMLNATPQKNGPVFIRVCSMDQVKYLLGSESGNHSNN